MFAVLRGAGLLILHLARLQVGKILVRQLSQLKTDGKENPKDWIKHRYPAQLSPLSPLQFGSLHRVTALAMVWVTSRSPRLRCACTFRSTK